MRLISWQNPFWQKNGYQGTLFENNIIAGRNTCTISPKEERSRYFYLLLSPVDHLTATSTKKTRNFNEVFIRTTWTPSIFILRKKKNKMNFFIFIWEGCPLAVPTSKWRCPLLEPVSVAVEMLLLMLLMPLPTNFLLAAIAQR